MTRCSACLKRAEKHSPDRGIKSKTHISIAVRKTAWIIGCFQWPATITLTRPFKIVDAGQLSGSSDFGRAGRIKRSAAIEHHK